MAACSICTGQRPGIANLSNTVQCFLSASLCTLSRVGSAHKVYLEVAAGHSMERKYGLGAKWAKMPAEVNSRTASGTGKSFRSFFVYMVCMRACARSFPVPPL